MNTLSYTQTMNILRVAKGFIMSFALVHSCIFHGILNCLLNSSSQSFFYNTFLVTKVFPHLSSFGLHVQPHRPLLGIECFIFEVFLATQ